MNRPPRSRGHQRHQYRRTYQACLNCRKHKAKCEVTGSSEDCKRCRSKQLDCRYPSKRPWDRSSHPSSLQNTSNVTMSEEEILRTWDACRFVRMGWFSAPEALLLVEHFFSCIAPKSPILTTFYASPSHHYWLITQEPVLCCIILLISSRFHPLPGGNSRSFFIHQRLWQHCQHLILRITLGQEKLSKAKTRHLGTIEALLLLSEWYPRSLHFPPDNDGWDADLMLTVPDERDPPVEEEEVPLSRRWMEDVVEPTRRADRMSWMLLSAALALAHELRVFDAVPSRGGGPSTGRDAEIYVQQLEIRRQRLLPLLFVFINGLASRIGCTSPMPDFKGSNWSIPDPGWTDLMTSWVELTRMNRGVTNQVMKHDGNMQRLDGWRDKLRHWKQQHEISGSDLHLEYEHLRVFTNSLGIQSIVEQVLNCTPESPEMTFVARARQLNLTTSQYEYIEEVIDAACAILTYINAQQPLQYLPIRVFHRGITSSILLLKALALGVRTSKLQDCLQLLDQTITAFQSDPLDDIHLIPQYATLLEIHVSRLRQHLASINRPDPIDYDIDWSSDWLSLPFDPLMAPFGELEDQMDSAWGLDFIWNLPDLPLLDE